MQVLVFTTWFPDAQAPSTAPFALNHVRAIAAQHDVKVVHIMLGGSGGVVVEDFEGISVTRIPLSPKRPWSYGVVLGHLRQALKQADILHTMAFTSAAVAAPAALGRRKTWVHTEHWSGVNNPASVSKAWVVMSWLRYLLRLPHAVTAVSEAQAVGLRRFSRGGAVYVVPNVVTKVGEPAPRAGGNSGRVEVVSVGGLNAGKRPGLAVEALHLLRNQGLDASLTWVGDGPLRGEIEQQIDRLGLGSHVTVTGMVPPTQVADHLRRADIFLLPTAHETFCMAAAEGVAMGLPVVITDLPAVRDFLTSENSLLVSGESAQDFCAGVCAAVDKFSTVSAAAISGTLPTRFTPENVASQFTQIYDRVRGGAG